MTAGLAGRVAVVTGGASGIGRATVLRFLEDGARVMFGDLNEAGGEALAAEVGDAARLRFRPADVAVELAAHRIRVNAVCPGLIDTPMVMRGNREAVAGRLASFQPWPDLGRPEHVASVASFLAGPDSEFVTGTAITVDGGMTAWGARMEGAHDQSGVTRRHSGFSYGSTGLPPMKRPSNETKTP